MKPVIMNEVRRGFYLDSVALMRISQTISNLDGIEEAAVMMGTPANQVILADAGLMSDNGKDATGGDLIIAVRANKPGSAKEAMATASSMLDAPARQGSTVAAWRPRSLRSAGCAFPSANMALVSVPGAYAAGEAFKAIRSGLHAMIFSDNVSLAQEIALKKEAKDLGLLVMGPDCGTSIIAGTPLAFANEVRRGSVGIIGASGTGIQEVSCLVDRLGGGISHAIGVGGRDLTSDVGGISTIMAIDALSSDPQTTSMVVIAKPPGDDVVRKVLDRLQSVGKPAVVCFLGAGQIEMPFNVRQATTLMETAMVATGHTYDPVEELALPSSPGKIVGLYSGGTLCAEAQVMILDAGLSVYSNAPVSGAQTEARDHAQIIDLGADEYTLGHPHPMIEPAIRQVPLHMAMGKATTGVIIFDVVIGHGAHPDPAGKLSKFLGAWSTRSTPVVICSVTGTEADPQVLSVQENKLRDAGALVAPSNEYAVRWAIASSCG